MKRCDLSIYEIMFPDQQIFENKYSTFNIIELIFLNNYFSYKIQFLKFKIFLRLDVEFEIFFLILFRIIFSTSIVLI